MEVNVQKVALNYKNNILFELTEDYTVHSWYLRLYDEKKLRKCIYDLIVYLLGDLVDARISGKDCDNCCPTCRKGYEIVVDGSIF